MYFGMAVTGIVLILLGFIIPHRCDKKYLDGNTLGITSSKEDEKPSDFGMEVITKQLELTNKRIDDVTEKLSQLEEYINTSVYVKHNEAFCACNNNTDNHEVIVPMEDGSSAFEEEKVSFKDVNSIIYDMHDNGVSLDDISSTLRMGKGELQLRLGLRKSQGK